VVPEPVKNSHLVTSGPYRVIRHPMYASILIFITGILSGDFSFYKVSIGLILIAGLVVKMIYEEQLLSQQHSDYQDYIRKTKRVIPFVW
jgi:protein-S-isoprenylcysteine O-methyltransferase Ste14